MGVGPYGIGGCADGAGRPLCLSALRTAGPDAGGCGETVSQPVGHAGPRPARGGVLPARARPPGPSEPLSRRAQARPSPRTVSPAGRAAPRAPASRRARGRGRGGLRFQTGALGGRGISFGNCLPDSIAPSFLRPESLLLCAALSHRVRSAFSAAC